MWWNFLNALTLKNIIICLVIHIGFVLVIVGLIAIIKWIILRG
jgi:hypothetical protein